MQMWGDNYGVRPENNLIPYSINKLKKWITKHVDDLSNIINEIVQFIDNQCGWVEKDIYREFLSDIGWFKFIEKK
jgi:hypothetical protein